MGFYTSWYLRPFWSLAPWASRHNSVVFLIFVTIGMVLKMNIIYKEGFKCEFDWGKKKKVLIFGKCILNTLLQKK